MLQRHEVRAGREIAVAMAYLCYSLMAINTHIFYTCSCCIDTTEYQLTAIYTTRPITTMHRLLDHQHPASNNSTQETWQQLDLLIQAQTICTYALVCVGSNTVLHPPSIGNDMPLLDNQDAAAVAACLEAPKQQPCLHLHLHGKVWQHVVVKQNDWQLVAVTRHKRMGIAAFRLRCGVLVVCWQHPVQPQVAVAAVQGILQGCASTSNTRILLQHTPLVST